MLLGELDKFVPLAAARFADVTINASSCSCELRGSPGEVVNVTALERSGNGWVASSEVVTMDDAGTGRVVFQ